MVNFFLHNHIQMNKGHLQHKHKHKHKHTVNLPGDAHISELPFEPVALLGEGHACHGVQLCVVEGHAFHGGLHGVVHRRDEGHLQVE